MAHGSDRNRSVSCLAMMSFSSCQVPGNTDQHRIAQTFAMTSPAPYFAWTAASTLPLLPCMIHVNYFLEHTLHQGCRAEHLAIQIIHRAASEAF